MTNTTSPNNNTFVPKVIVIDDNDQNLEIARTYLNSLKYIVSIASSGRKALSMIESDKPDLIILDIMMPVMDGFEFCSIIKSKKTTKDIPIIFLTALSETRDIVKAFNYGAVDYITKPFTREEFILRVKNHINIITQTRIIKEQNQKLNFLNQEKDGLLQITIHDLKNPLQTVLGYSDLIIRKLSKSDEYDLLKFLNPLRQSTLQAINIIQDLLEVNRLEEGNYILDISKIDFRNVLMRAVDSFTQKASEKQISIIYNETDEECFVEADGVKLERVFDNLISNALKFSPSYTKITINCKIIQATNRPAVIAEIIDEGPGFKDEDIPMMFKKFAKLSAKPTGEESTTGLGLSIVKKLTEAMSGKISFETIQGKGTKFTVEFDLV
ncbi:MAG: hybrid sensor histidine kinase/response regulator [Candidatus Kapabacteria bacterium]|nr:hybrid sensor histidine kinase/response regulator [Candidatus Kapabacteria bacterium]